MEVCNGASGATPVSPPPEINAATLPPPGKPVDPSRDIETLNEDELQGNNVNEEEEAAASDDEPQLGSVFPTQPVSTSFEQVRHLERISLFLRVLLIHFVL